MTIDQTYDGRSKPQGATRSFRRRPADLAIATLADQFAIQKAKKDANSLFRSSFSVFLEREESVDHIIVLQMAPCIRAYPVAAPLIVRGLARVWAAKMLAAESWRFPLLSLQCALEFTRAFSGTIIQQANSR